MAAIAGIFTGAGGSVAATPPVKLIIRNTGGGSGVQHLPGGSLIPRLRPQAKYHANRPRRKVRKQMRYSSPSWNVESRFASWQKQLQREARKFGYRHRLDTGAYRHYFADGYTPRAAWLEDLSQG